MGAIGVLALLVLGGPAGAEHGTPGTNQLVSRASGLGAVPAATTNNSFLHEDFDENLNAAGRAISGDGRYVVFASDADGLSTEDDNRYRNVFVRDRQSQTTTLVSRAGGPSGVAANADSFEPTISQDGTTVAFTTKASNLGDGAPSNSNTKVYVRTVATGATKLASRATGAAGTVASSFTGQPSLDADGGKVAFATFTTLDAADTGTFDRDVYVRTVATDTTTYVSRADGVSGAEGDGESKAPSISGDGSRVAFESVATNLVGATDTNGKRDVFVRDLGGGTTVLVSRATTSGGVIGNQDSANPSISNDGTKVALASNATNLDAAATSGTNVFVRDLTGSTTTLASRKDGVAGGQANAANIFSSCPTISFDGTAVAFFVGGADIEPGFSPSWFQVYVRFLGTGVTKLASRPDGNTIINPDGLSRAPSLSADGKLVVFDSVARNLGTDADPEFRGVYLRDITNNTTKSLVRPGADNQAFANSGLDSSDTMPAGVSSDGQYVVFNSRANWISSDDNDAFTNVFVRDTIANTTTLVSRANGVAGAAANGDSFAGGISADGTKVVFISAGTNLMTPGHTTQAEVFVRNLATNTTVQVSPLDQNSASSEIFSGGTRARISGNGQKVAFQTAGNLDPDDTVPFSTDTYVVNADGTGTPVWVNRSSTGVPGNGTSVMDGFSFDGSRVAFDSTSTNIDPADTDNGPDVYVRDLGTNQTILASRANGAAGLRGDSESRGGDLSADGNRVAFSSFASNLLPTPYNTGQIFVRDLAAGTTILASRDDGAAGTETAGNPQAQPALSADGQRVAFAHSGSINGISNPDFAIQVYMRDLATNTTKLISHASGNATVAGNRFAQHPAISGNGDCVVFQSPAGDLVAGFPGGSDFSNVYLGTVARECPADPPNTAISSGPTGAIATRTPTFVFASDDNGATFECKLDGATFAACATPYTTPSLGDGSHTFTVRAVDQATYPDPTPSSRSFSVDATPPETTIDSGPATKVRSRNATLAFSSEPGATFTCSLDGAAAAACSSPASYPGLADGTHTFTVRAADALGNADASPASRSWTVDATAPKASLTVPKQRLGTAIARGVRFSLKTTEAGRFTLTLVYKGKTVGKKTVTAKGALAVKLNAKGKKALKKARSAAFTVKLTARDALGNTAASSKRFRLKR